jgi:hypothetical protein
MKNFAVLKEKIQNLDYYDCHYYESGALSYALLKDALAMAGDKPMVIGEARLKTWQKNATDTAGTHAEPSTLPRGNTEGQQAAFFASTMNAVKELKINSLAVWALYDFTADAIPKESQVARKPEQKFYGVYRSDRSPKAAVEVIRKAWAGTVLRSKDVLDLGFESTTDKVNPWTPYRTDLGEAERSSDQRHNGMGSIKFTKTGSNGSTFPSMRVSPVEIVRPGENIFSRHSQAIAGTWSRYQCLA